MELKLSNNEKTEAYILVTVTSSTKLNILSAKMSREIKNIGIRLGRLEIHIAL